MAKECLRLLLDRQPKMSGTGGPSVKELVFCMKQAGISCVKDACGLFRNPSYIVRMPGADYTLRAVRGIKGTYLVLGSYLEYHVAIHTIPEGFLSALNHFHNDIRPLIRPMLDDYCTEVRKRMMIDQIRKTAGKAR